MKIRYAMLVTGAVMVTLAACGGGGQQASQPKSQPSSVPSAPVLTEPSGPAPGALTVDKAGVTKTGDGQGVWGALVTNRDPQNIAFRVQTKITFFDAAGTAIGTTTDTSTDSILPGRTVALAGESASDVIPKGMTPVKATGKAEAVWQIMPRALRGGKVDLSDLKVEFTPGRDIDGKPDAQYNNTVVSVRATSSFGNTYPSRAAAVCMDSAGNIISGAPARGPDLAPNVPVIVQAMGIKGPQPASCTLTVEPKIGS